ncbi:hypothetical protein H0A36_16550 [Endozoicomonas sp. SM1973]|uniref:Uncharacterized protein n=1 Tax=Spartinivicinus marinus TaxID=2994442 RepID=A0A853IC24_9GAMM|nr:hypothetical protein [Spartinivicinus marinus]
MIHDQLDSIFVDLSILAKSGEIFASPLAKIENFADGLPRASLVSGLYVPVWLNYWFEPFDAFTVNQIFIRLVAYLGMYRLLTQHVTKGQRGYITSIFASLTFSLLPFYSLFGLSIAGQPLLLSAFFNIGQGKGRWQDWLILILLPFYTLFTLSGFFYFVLFCVILL